MSSELVTALDSFIAKRLPNLKYISLNWFGGEPLLAQDIILKITETVKAAQKNSNEKLTCYSSLTTNGYLLFPDTLKRLVNNGITSYQVTLDGIEENHDKTRRLINGKGTFSKIWSNIVGIRSTTIDCSIKLRLHYTEENYKDLIPLIQQINDKLLDDKRFSIYFYAIGRYGGVNDNDIAEVPVEVQSKISQYLGSFVKKDSIYKRTEKYICYASQLNSFVIRSNGIIQKCDLCINSDANNVGHLNMDGTMFLDKQKIISWSKGLELRNIEAMRCPYRYFIKHSE